MTRFAAFTTALSTSLLTASVALASSSSVSVDLNSSSRVGSTARATPAYTDKPGDINHDGLVNIDDLLIVINEWGDHSKTARSVADIAPAKGDSQVNLDDMLLVILNWGS